MLGQSSPVPSKLELDKFCHKSLPPQAVRQGHILGRMWDSPFSLDLSGAEVKGCPVRRADDALICNLPLQQSSPAHQRQTKVPASQAMGNSGLGKQWRVAKNDLMLGSKCIAKAHYTLHVHS